jgi:hypothetical protein
MKTLQVSETRNENLANLKAAMRRGHTTDQGADGVAYATRYEPAARAVAQVAKALGGKVEVSKRGSSAIKNRVAGQPWKVAMDLGLKVETFLLSPTMSVADLVRWENEAE